MFNERIINGLLTARKGKKRPLFQLGHNRMDEKMKEHLGRCRQKILMAMPCLFFLYFRLFFTFGGKQMFNKTFADDWIRTADLCCRKQQLYQMRHNSCP